jgi:hypothetical protein
VVVGGHNDDRGLRRCVARHRLIAVALMIVGIGFIGVFTATLTSFFLEPTRVADEQQNIDDRLARIEAKLDALARQNERLSELPVAK